MGGDTVGKREVAEECMSPARPAAMYICPDNMVPAMKPLTSGLLDMVATAELLVAYFHDLEVKVAVE